ncbi:MAG TPA: thioredoxin domain-containing protein [Vicinamibacterales bacterium]|jgi:protein-disulfide isomerase
MKFIWISLVLCGVACSSTSAQPSKAMTPSDVVATVGSTSITLAEVDEKALQQSATAFGSVRLAQALYEARRFAIDEIVANTLMDREAKTRGIERSALVEKEIADKVAPVGDAEVAAWYQVNQNRVQGAPLDQVRAPIRAYLIQQRMEDARQAYIDTLKAKTPVKISLDPPRLTVSGTGPSKGDTKAPIQMIEFSDFQCPFCLRAQPTVEQVLKTYGDRIHFVYRHYPLPSHPGAKPAAEASACANEQGKFWPYHDRLFEQPGKLSDADLKKSAADLGLDTARFNSCVDSHKYKDQVEADMKDGNDVGVDGTPAFFINGRMLSGAQPFEAFKKIIDEELSRQR